MSDPITDLATMIVHVAELRAALPPVSDPKDDWSSWRASHTRHREAVTAAVNELRQKHGARIHMTGSHSRMALLGVRASSTAGGAAMLDNWLANAREHMQKMAEAGA